jgi:hypothetical protein
MDAVGQVAGRGPPGFDAAVKATVIAHNERAKATQRAGIERAGGRL